ncbi:cobalamin biosynthesis protein CbiX [Streptodolium elevatio]|uniref:Cobalamin biosynthesis protein CbiX n=1 Tax=Streptodolium elevatio TaxID=3157996 RepID=A0ABV3DPI3_9ACTN
MDVAVVAVGGHESADGAALSGTFGAGLAAVPCGRALHQHVSALLRDTDSPVCVVPMTLGRDPRMVADTARTLLALPRESRERVVLADGFGTTEHLTGWLRAAASRVPAEHGLLVAAPAGDAYDDAELFRVARLVWQYGRHRIVEVALLGGDPDPERGAERCRALGAAQVTALAASFVAPGLPDAQPLLSPAAAARVLAARVDAALRRMRSAGDDGIGSALRAADHHGTSHSHGDGHGHAHGHADAYAHSHDHAHAHAHPRPHRLDRAAPAPVSPVS